MSAEQNVSAKFARSLEWNISWCGARPTIARSKARPEKTKKKRRKNQKAAKTHT